MAARVLVLHWNAADAAECVERLRKAGFHADHFVEEYGEGFKRIRANPPDAIVIDLGRRPATGREIGIHLRGHSSTRNIPLVFIEGDDAITAQIQSLLPDAQFTSWANAAAALKRALSNPPLQPVSPGTFAGYSGTPLPKKLRIQEGSVVALLHAPGEFLARFEPILPPGVTLQKRPGAASVILGFYQSAAVLELDLAKIAPEIQEGRTLWLIWPKKTSGVATDLSEPKVRELGLAYGLVDYKVCAVDETWSGLAFAVRKARRANAK